MPRPSGVVVDKRETRSGVPGLLESMGIHVDYRTLAVGDYVVSSRYVVERKTARDFINSLFSGRLFDQLNRLSESYGQCIVVVEGNLSEALEQLSNPRGIWGAMLTLIFDYACQVFFTGDGLETANLLYVLATREIGMKTVRPLIYRKIRARTIEEVQLNILGNIPGVGPILAERLLRCFGSLRKALDASPAELRRVEGIGRMKAEGIAKILDAPHKIEEHRAAQSRL